MSKKLPLRLSCGQQLPLIPISTFLFPHCIWLNFFNFFNFFNSFNSFNFFNFFQSFRVEPFFIFIVYI